MKYLMAIIFLLYAPSAFSYQARSVFLTDKKIETIQVGVGRSSILSFPSRPTKIVLGSHGQFAVEYVENDLAIAALKPGAHSNLFVYLEGRRFGFDLRTTTGVGDEIVLIRDSNDRKMKVKIKND